MLGQGGVWRYFEMVRDGRAQEAPRDQQPAIGGPTSTRTTRQKAYVYRKLL